MIGRQENEVAKLKCCDNCNIFAAIF